MTSISVKLTHIMHFLGIFSGKPSFELISSRISFFMNAHGINKKESLGFA